MRQIDHVFLTHSTSIIAALPLMLDAVSSLRSQPMQVHAPAATIAALQAHVFNNIVWPDFSCPLCAVAVLRYVPLAAGETVTAAGLVVQVLPAVHSVYRLWATLYEASTAGGPSAEIPSATRRCGAHWSSLPKPRRPNFPSLRWSSKPPSATAKRPRAHSQHLSPTTLAAELALRTPTASYPIYITHTKPSRNRTHPPEINQLELAEDVEIGWLQVGQVFECNETRVG